MLTVENLSRHFDSKIAVDNISFSIKPGVITGLLGPNGAGKTTTMRLITGFLKPTSGLVLYKNNPVSDGSDDIKSKLGYLPESAPLYPEMKVLEYLQFMADIRGVPLDKQKEAVHSMVELCELETKLESIIAFLSKGFKQRVALAGTLIHDPDVIILDEPTSGLDPNQISHVRDLIKKLGKEKTLILSTHILQEVEDVCDEVIIINNGRIVANSSVKNLYGDNKVQVVVKASIEQVTKVFSTEPFIGVESFTEDNEKQEDGYHSFLVSLKEYTPEAVFQTLSKHSLFVREIKIYKKSLESIFSELTK
jgi:ABC-2 type transport system ATP-binding protein